VCGACSRRYASGLVTAGRDAAPVGQLSPLWGELSSPRGANHPGEDTPGLLRDIAIAPGRQSAWSWQAPHRATAYRAPRDCLGSAGAGGGLEQAEFAGAADRGFPVLRAKLAVQGALMCFHGVE
jgi:hypothetical protein